MTEKTKRHGHHNTGGPRTLDEAALRAEQVALRSKRPLTIQASARLKQIRRSLQAIERRSPHKAG